MGNFIESKNGNTVTISFTKEKALLKKKDGDDLCEKICSFVTSGVRVIVNFENAPMCNHDFFYSGVCDVYVRFRNRIPDGYFSVINMWQIDEKYLKGMIERHLKRNGL